MALKNSNFIFIVGVLAFFALSLSLASALTANPSTLTLTANQSTSNQLTFILNNTDLRNITSLTLSATSLQSGLNVISSGNISLPSVGMPLNANSATSILTATVSIPQYQAQGTYIGSITATGTYSDSTQVQLQSPISLTVMVNPTNSLTVTSNPASINKASPNSAFIITNTGNTVLSNIQLSYDTSTFKDKSNRQVTLAFLPSTFSLNPGSSQQVNITSTIPSSLNPTTYTTTITLSANSITATAPLSLRSDYCASGINASSDIEIDSIKDLTSDTDWKWYPLNKVDVEVKVRNNDPDNDKDVVVSIDLYDEDNQKFITDINDEKTISVNSDKTKTVTFSVKVPSDTAEKNYKFYVKAYEDGNEKGQCNEDFKIVEVKRNSRDVILDSINGPSSISCGSAVDITATAVNIGTHNEDKVRVKLYNRELNLNLYSNDFSLDTDSDGKKVSFSGFSIPLNATEKNYTLELTAEYNYDSDADSYADKSDVYPRSLVVQGNCQPVVKQSALITADLTSDAVAGKEMTVKVTIKNTGDSTTAYTLTASDYSSWASLEKIDPTILAVDAGQSADAIVYLKPAADVSGDQTFKVNVVYGGKITTQTISVPITKSAGFSITGNAIVDSIQQNWFIWLVVINIVLVIAIIIVAVKITSSRRKVEEE